MGPGPGAGRHGIAAIRALNSSRRCSNSVRQGLFLKYGGRITSTPFPPQPPYLVAELAESGSREVAVKSKGFPDSQRSHEGEASGIHKGIFAFVMAT